MNSPQQNYSIKPAHDVLRVDMYGTWSPDTTLAYVAEYKKLVSRYFAREWVAVINIQNLDMLVSESFQIETLKALNTWSFIKGMKAVSVVSQSSNRHHLLYQFEDIFDDQVSFEKAFCFNEQEVSAWLEQQGFHSGMEVRSQKSA